MKKCEIIITAGLFSAVLLCGCNNLGGGTNINLGMDAIEHQEYDTAIGFFDKALQADEDKKLAYRGKGIAFMGQGHYDEAADAFDKALKNSNGIVKKVDYDINYYLAMAEYKRGEADKAMEVYDAIIALNDDDFEAYYLRGCLELIRQDKTAALSDFDKAVELQSSDYDLYISIYEALSSAGYDSEGKSYISKALEHNGKMTDYQSGLFSYYLGAYDDARNSLEKAREKDTSENLILYLGRAYKALGDVNYAIGLFSEYLSEHPDSASMYNELGLIYLEQKDYQNALNSFENGKALNDPAFNQSLMFNEVVSYEYLLNFEKASELMLEYLDKYPTDEAAQREYIFLSTR
ncbi:MAG: tetratricopeptide repeat protein [Lachnospiraceae bacterium]|nr:tetratricopeptide repeat protein [Lachnospiraceae bacterium]